MCFTILYTIYHQFTVPEALETIFHGFTSQLHPKKKYQGYLLFAVDGPSLKSTAYPQNLLSYLLGTDRQRRKKLFPLPNGIFSLGLSAGELAIYAYLMYCEDRRSHQCWPSYKTIGRAIGMSENTIRK